MTEQELQDALHAMLAAAPHANFDNDPVVELPFALARVTRVDTYRDAGILSQDAGVVVRTEDGREFQITVVRRR